MRNLLVLSLALNIFFVGGLGLAFGFPGTHEVQAQASESKSFDDVVKKPEDKEAGASVQLMQLAGDLARWGRDNKHAGAIAVASSILGSVPAKESKALAKKFADGAAVEDAGPGTTSESLLQEAKEMAGAGGAPFVEAITKMGMKGRGFAKGVLQAQIVAPPSTKSEKGEFTRGQVAEKLTFKVGELAAIWVGGDGSTDLDLYILDAAGKVVIASDTRPGDSCWVEWVPTEAEYFLLVINWGAKKNSFTIVLN